MTGFSPMARLAVLGVAGTLLLALAAMAGTGFLNLTSTQASESGPTSEPVDAQGAPALKSAVLNLRYELEVEGSIMGLFTQIEGLTSFSEVVIDQVVGPSGELITRKTPGEPHWGEITLKREFTGNLELWDWRSQLLQGPLLQDGSIVVRNKALEEVARADFTNGWPSGWAIEDSEGQGTAVEEITIVHNGLTGVQ